MMTSITQDSITVGFSKESILDTVGAGKFLNLSPATLEKYRQRNSSIKGPRFMRFGNHKIFYKIADLQEWLKERLVERD